MKYKYTCPRNHCQPPFVTNDWNTFETHMSKHNKEDETQTVDEIAELKAQVKTLQAQVKALLDAVPSAKVNA